MIDNYKFLFNTRQIPFLDLNRNIKQTREQYAVSFVFFPGIQKLNTLISSQIFVFLLTIEGRPTSATGGGGLERPIDVTFRKTK
ncbi:hypothetical protein CUU64_17175 [Bacillus sp. V5-8f]|nr:hypothetical protein CUU64_17175 [Bacillus sp. V5-8f]